MDDPFAHAQYGAFFLAGALFARAPTTWPRIGELRAWALGLALLAWLVAVAGAPPSVRLAAHSVAQWCGVLAALGYAHRFLDRDGALRRYLTDAVFPL